MGGKVITRMASGNNVHVISSSFYGTCATAKNTAAKEVIVANPNINKITLVKGMTLTVKFADTNAVVSPTLTIFNNSGTEDSPIKGSITLITAKTIYRYGTTAPSTSAASSWQAGAIVLFIYDGTNWLMINDNNTTALTDMSGTLDINQGGTGKTTATEAWTALGGGDIGTKTSLTAADIPNISTSKLTSGTLEVARGGTGLTAAPSMIVNLESTAAVSIFDATLSPGVTGTLPISQGGTEATAASQARQNLNVPTVSSQTNQNIFFSPLSTSGQCQGIYFNVTNNANTTYLNKRLALIIKNEGISLYNSTDTATIWSINSPVSIAQGGTGKTTATEAWTALGGGDIGKKASLSAADIPNLSTSKITSGTLGIDRGGTGKATTTLVNYVFASPSASVTEATAPSWRKLVAADIPNLSADKITGGTINGNITVTGTLTVEGHAGQIGSSATVTGSKSTSSGTTASICSYSLNPGVWIAIGNAYFQTTASGGYRDLYIGTSSTSVGSLSDNEELIQYTVNSGNNSKLQIVRSITNTAKTTYYFNVMHNAGSITVSGRLKFIRIA